MSVEDLIPTTDTLKEQAVAISANRARKWAHGDRSFLGKTLRAVVLLFRGFFDVVRQYWVDAVPSPDSSHTALGRWLFSLGRTTGTPGRYGFRDPIPARGAIGQLTGTGGKTAAAGAELVGPDGVTRFKLRALITLPAVAGTAQAPGTIDAITPGVEGNLNAGAVLSWDPTPAGFDPTVTLVQGFGNTGKPGESDGDAYRRIVERLQLPPGGGRPQDYGHGGEAWAENAVDADGNPILGVRVYGYSRNGGYDGVGGPMGVMTKTGSGLSRKPTTAELTDTILYVKGTTGIEGRAPIAHSVRYIGPYMPPERALIVKVRGKESKAAFALDWKKEASLLVVAYAPGPPALVTLAVLAPLNFKEAIDQGRRPRIFIDTRSGSNHPTGPVIPTLAHVVAWQDIAGPATRLTLEDPLPPGWQAPSFVGTEEVYPGGPFVVPCASALIEKADELGPARGDFADENDIWKDTLSINNLVTAAENVTDTDGITPLLDKVLTGGVTIGIGPAGVPAAQDVQASDNSINGPELLYLSRVIVTGAVG